MTIITIINEYLMGIMGKIPSYLRHFLVIRSEEALFQISLTLYFRFVMVITK